jgi:hypothetical protein
MDYVLTENGGMMEFKDQLTWCRRRLGMRLRRNRSKELSRGGRVKRDLLMSYVFDIFFMINPFRYC